MRRQQHGLSDLADGSYKRAVNTINPLGTKGALATAVANLITVLWGEQYTFVSPVSFRVRRAARLPD